MVTLTIDGHKLQVAAGANLLEAAAAAQVRIPTLCHHPALEPYGGCRLCLVDVGRNDSGAARKLVAACMHGVEEGLDVRTDSEQVRAARRVTVDLLLARCPDTPLVQALAREHGIERTSYAPNPEPTDCVLCGLCTRACDRVGASAIATVNRGTSRVVGPPYDQAPPDCIGCLACAEVCPTGHIKATATATTRTIWGRTFELVRCPVCGRTHATREQIGFVARHSAAAVAATGGTAPDCELCEACRRRRVADTVAAIGATPLEGVL
jgi:NADH dehydrogenase/NADH:ubiquinone oxidoreductase subunit G